MKTMMPFSLRHQLSQMDQLGSGNFLEFAVEYNPNRSETLMWFENSYEIFVNHWVDSFSLNQLKSIVDSYATWYHSKGILEKDLVAIYLDNGVGYFIHYLALNTIGAIPVLVNGNMSGEIASEYILNIGVKGLFTDKNHIDNVSEILMKGLEFISTCVNRPNGSPYTGKFRHANNDPVMICHSSGTTGDPKAVTFQHGQFFGGKRNRLVDFASEQTNRILCAMPHSHSAAISYLMTSTLIGMPTFIA